MKSIRLALFAFALNAMAADRVLVVTAHLAGAIEWALRREGRARRRGMR